MKLFIKGSVGIGWKGLFMERPCGTPRMNLSSLGALGSLASGSEPFEGTRSEIDLECIARISSI